jgi:ATP-binding cassette, subfamily B, bacterial PglK
MPKVDSTERRVLQRTEVAAASIPMQFVNVSFRYPGRDRNAVSGLNFTVRSGESIGIVGASGAGKSTLLDLMLGLLHPDTGEITAFGQPLDEVLARWRSSLGYVPQTIFLLDDTLEANIRLGLSTGMSDERLAAAISTAGLDELIRQLPRGLATRVGEHGSRLSGGQRQRVGLARALYADPAVLLLDEATSALDNETEREVSRALQALHGRVTTVIIAHRLSTVKACDRILFLSEGRIAGEGGFMHLKATNPQFARLVALGSLLD